MFAHICIKKGLVAMLPYVLIVNPGCIVPGVAGMTWPRLLTLDASCLVLQG